MSERSARLGLDEQIETARSDPGKLYDETYYSAGYSAGTSHKYGRHEPWMSFFGRIAKRIDKTFKPKTVADVGCAFGLLTEALVDRGIDAYGFDVSPYAVSNARSDMEGRLTVHSVVEPIPLRDGKKYDMVVCIEMLEHLPPEQTDLAITNLCACTERILFSSSPDDFDEPTHFNVLPTEEWLKKFKAHGFLPAKTGHFAKYIAPQARVVERNPTTQPRLWAKLTCALFR